MVVEVVEVAEVMEVVEVVEVMEVVARDMDDPVMNKGMEKVEVNKELGNKEVYIMVWEWSLMSLILLKNCLRHQHLVILL